MNTAQLQNLIRRYNRLIYKAHKKSLKKELASYPSAARNARALIPMFQSEVRRLEEQLAARIKDAHG